MYQLNYLGIILLIFYVSSPISRNAYFIHMQITHKHLQSIYYIKHSICLINITNITPGPSDASFNTRASRAGKTVYIIVEFFIETL